MTTQNSIQTISAERMERLRQIVREGGYEAAALNPSPTLKYLTKISYHLSERPVILFIPAHGDAAMIIPQLELPKIADNPPFPTRFFSYTDTDGYLGAFEQACKALGLAGKRLAVEGLKMRVLEGQLIQKYAPNCTVISADAEIMRLRLYKSADEIAAMREAIRVTEAALDATLPKVRPGMTEQQVTNLLLNAMAELGSGGNAFDPIILTGPNSALPHGNPGAAVVKEGDLLLFDFGTTFDGYPADLTRTFAVGEIDAELKKIYEVVLMANQEAIKAARPGIAAQELDRIAREVIEDSGYGKYFIHRTGHGLGIEGHEAPNIVEGNTQILEPGMVFTIEPGIYLPGKGGVRIEDNVVITENGADVLTTYPRALRVIGQ